MSTSDQKPQGDDRACERCGQIFTCHAMSSAPCWCNQYTLPAEALKEISEQFNHCLCPACLKVFAEKG